MKKQLAPVVIFVYARPEHTKKMIESLSKNKLAKQSDVWIFSDYAKKESAIDKVNQVRKYIHGIKNEGYFKEVHIIEEQKNKGLANSVIEGVGKIIKEFDKVIVVEDDLILTENFLEYMNEALEFYKEDNRIWSISGYNVPMTIPKKYNKDIYLNYRGCSWGWATWKDRWDLVDWKVEDYKSFKRNIFKRKKFNRGGEDMALMLDSQVKGKIDSWAIRWCYEQSKRDMYTIYPVKSLVYNDGLDGSGTHSGTNNAFSVTISNEKRNFVKDIQFDNKIMKEFCRHFKIGWKGNMKNFLICLGLEGVVDIAKRGRKN